VLEKKANNPLRQRTGAGYASQASTLASTRIDNCGATQRLR